MRSLADVPVRTGRSSKAYTAQADGTIRYIVFLAVLSALYNRIDEVMATPARVFGPPS
jgi:hypothetical protein